MTAATCVTQCVCDVERAATPIPEVPPKESVEGLTGRAVEACSDYRGTLVPCRYHPFVAALDAAFCGHRPLALSQDMLWLLVAQGLGRHVAADPEGLRGHFVRHEGREKISVRRDDFVKGSPENPWAEAFGEFSSQIREKIGGENHDRLLASFSTTGPVERAAGEVALMGTLQSYFEYEFVTLCAIPELTLEGMPDDWRRLRDATAAVGEAYDLTWWTDQLAPTST
jgi:hypothetical protein